MTRTRRASRALAAASLAAVAAAAVAAPPAALADKLCQVGPAQPLEQALEGCDAGDVVLAVFAAPRPGAPQPSPAPSRPQTQARAANLVARVCDLRREVFLQPGSTEEHFVLACAYAGRVL